MSLCILYKHVPMYLSSDPSHSRAKHEAVLLQAHQHALQASASLYDHPGSVVVL